MEGHIGTSEVGSSPAASDRTVLSEDEAERALVRSMVKGMLLFVPVMIAFWMILVAIAIGGAKPDLAAWLGMAAVIGVLAGVFFGAWAGFVATAPVLDEIDLHAHRSRPIGAPDESRPDQLISGGHDTERGWTRWNVSSSDTTTAPQHTQR